MIQTLHSPSSNTFHTPLMDHKKPTYSDSNKIRLPRSFTKCIHPQTPTDMTPPPPKYPRNRRFKSQEFPTSIIKDAIFTKSKSQRLKPDDQISSHKTRAAKEALLSRLFATLSSVKAAYAELQNAQYPYNSRAVQAADEAIVNELMVLSELKQKYLSKTFDVPPPVVTLLLAEIQEQQCNIKTYEIAMNQLESKIQQKDKQILGLTKKFEELIKVNKGLDKKLRSSGLLNLISPEVSVSHLNFTHFIRVLHHATRSVRHFVKQLERQMEYRNWDTDSAAKAIERDVVFTKPKHKVFAFESYIHRVMFDGFNQQYFSVAHEPLPENKQHRQRHLFFERFRRLQSVNAGRILRHNPNCAFAKFCKTKYLNLVHPKMECSFFGNLDQRKIISSGGFPCTEFFTAFAEMAIRVWLLHCLAFSFDPPAVAFQVKKGCRFSEMYMESITDGALCGDYRVALTVVPGFKINKAVVQSQVYLFPATASSSSR